MGASKKAGEELFFDYAKETGAKVAVYRFPNLMGHSRPKYNSAVSTFCWAVANDEPFTVNDRSTELELLYIDDLVEGMFDLLEGREQHCEFDGVETVLKADGRYCCVPVTHKVTLGEIVDLLAAIQDTAVYADDAEDAGRLLCQEAVLPVPDLSTHATKFKYTLKMNVDEPRLLYRAGAHRRLRAGQSVNISRPGVTKGQHWHNSKWELFIVVARSRADPGAEYPHRRNGGVRGLRREDRSRPHDPRLDAQHHQPVRNGKPGDGDDLQ